jgi:hypothetical protein
LEDPAAARRSSSKKQVFENDVLLGSILSLLPKKSFRFTGAVGKRFKRVYLDLHDGDTTTSFKHAVKTIATADVWLFENHYTNLRTRRDGGRVFRACTIAATFGRLKILQYLRKKRKCAWSQGTTTGAAQYGHLATLKWARTHGCPWSRAVSTRAAAAGHIDVLEWLTSHKCPWHPAQCEEVATENGHTHVVEWIANNRTRGLIRH